MRVYEKKGEVAGRSRGRRRKRCEKEETVADGKSERERDGTAGRCWWVVALGRGERGEDASGSQEVLSTTCVQLLVPRLWWPSCVEAVQEWSPFLLLPPLPCSLHPEGDRFLLFHTLLTTPLSLSSILPESLARLVSTTLASPFVHVLSGHCVSCRYRGGESVVQVCPRLRAI